MTQHDSQPNTYQINQAGKRIAVGTAHSKIILMGEHAVVYDYPAIALPFPTANVKVSISPSEGDQTILHSHLYHGPLEQAPNHLANIQKAYQVTHSLFKLPHQALYIDIESSIPAERGMGSSAAVAVALVRAICQYYQRTIQDYQLHFIVNQAEVIAHESTSGLDTLITSSNQPVIYRKSAQPIPLDINLNAYLIVADSDQAGQTKLAVGKVRKLKDKRPEFIHGAMSAIGNFVMGAVEAIQHHDVMELGRLMTYNHYYLNQLEISNGKLDQIVNAAWLAGALGAKLTGGGLGGCVIALAETESAALQVESAMLSAGADQTWLLDLSSI